MLAVGVAPTSPVSHAGPPPFQHVGRKWEKMNLPWFRFYAEVLNDAKVQTLNPVLFKHWVNLLCYASQRFGNVSCNNDVAFYLRLQSAEDARVILLELYAAGLLTIPDDITKYQYKINGWEKRQYNSDVSTGRVKKYRDKMKQQGNVSFPVSETPPDTDTDTEILLSDDNNIKPKKSEKLKMPPDVSEGVWEDFVKHRKAKRAPVTETVINSIRREALKIAWTLDKALAEVCARGWQGFKAEWITNNQSKGNQNATAHHNLTKAQRADIALGIVNHGTDERMDGSTPDAFAPVLRQLTEIR